MEVIQSKIFPEVKLFIPKVYNDHRGFFTETFNISIQNELGVHFYQDNHHKSKKNVIRGIHYQWYKPMGKLCRVVKGSGIDVLVDLRPNSPTYKQSETIFLSDENFIQVWVPEGFGHGFLALEEDTHFCYKCSALHNGDNEGAIHPFDPTLNINWTITREEAILSEKDTNAQSFEEYNLNPKF
jgi:dTDP-4-dehydrorhamnose 3,5-epimerase